MKKAAIFTLSGCGGDQLQIVDTGKEFFELLKHVKFQFFPMIKEHESEQGPFDIAFIEGTVTTKEDVKLIKEARQKSKIVVALGTCATHGGIPSIKHFLDQKKIERAVYFYSYKLVDSIDPAPVDKYIKVDVYLRGCPIDKQDFLRVMKDLLRDKKPAEYNKPVCVECKNNENECLLLNGEDCLGPLTCGGCNSVCVNNKIACYGCRGPIDDANVAAEVELLKKKGHSAQKIKEKFRMFAGRSKKLKRWSNANY